MKAYLEDVFRNATQLAIDYFLETENKYDFGNSDVVTIGHDTPFQYIGLMKAHSLLKKKHNINIAPQELAKKIMECAATLDKKNKIGVISELKHVRVFLSINIYPIAMAENCWKMCNDFIKEEDFFKVRGKRKKKIAIDYSSPNMAKSLHIGHLRSTIIGQTIVRALEAQGHDVTGINHVGDWGTQFGMIICYLKKRFNNSQYEIMEYISNCNANDLMEIYRHAKTMFDCKPVINTDPDDEKVLIEIMKADKKSVILSRNEAALLQKGDEFNTKLWKKICQISRDDFEDIYKILNIHNLNEIGESFYQKFIPDIMVQLRSKDGMVQEHEGSYIIKLEHWSIPLFLIKSNGSIGYDMTDLAALYYRLVLQKYDYVIYITDSGQRKHFDMCFEVARLMGWINDSNSVKHIGFGLVNLKSGKKIKTRSGNVVLMRDVIDDVINEAKTVVKERTKDTNSVGTYYSKMDETTVNEVCKKIGINTLKYFDLSHSHSSSYKYDPKLMFRFQGNTGVYQMYSYARINGIIEKSNYSNLLNADGKSDESLMEFSKKCMKNFENEDFVNNITNEELGLIECINQFPTYFNRACEKCDTNLLTKYLYSICDSFNKFVCQKDGKIIGSNKEPFRVNLCIFVLKIIEFIFDILSMEIVEHI